MYEPPSIPVHRLWAGTPPESLRRSTKARLTTSGQQSGPRTWLTEGQSANNHTERSEPLAGASNGASAVQMSIPEPAFSHSSNAGYSFNLSNIVIDSSGSTHDFEAQSFVGPLGSILWFDAQAEARNAASSSVGHQTMEEPPIDSLSPVFGSTHSARPDGTILRPANRLIWPERCRDEAPKGRV